MSENIPVPGGELVEDSVVNQKFTTAADGKHYRVTHYKLSAVTSTPKWAK